MKVTIYHSTAHGFRFMPWSRDAPMSRVDEFELPVEQFPEPSDDALGHVFRIHNAWTVPSAMSGSGFEA